MTTHLKDTTVFEAGQVERLDHDWQGWDVDAAALVMRAQRNASGAGWSTISRWTKGTAKR